MKKYFEPPGGCFFGHAGRLPKWFFLLKKVTSKFKSTAKLFINSSTFNLVPSFNPKIMVNWHPANGFPCKAPPVEGSAGSWITTFACRQGHKKLCRIHTSLQAGRKTGWHFWGCSLCWWLNFGKVTHQLREVPGKPSALFLSQKLLVLGVKLPKKRGHLGFQVGSFSPLFTRFWTTPPPLGGFCLSDFRHQQWARRRTIVEVYGIWWDLIQTRYPTYLPPKKN